MSPPTPADIAPIPSPAAGPLIAAGGQDLADLAAMHRTRQQLLAARASEAARRAWAMVDPNRPEGSWADAAPGMLRAMTAAQAEAARGAQDYVTTATRLQGADPDPYGQVALDAFAGTAADGRPLASLLANPAGQVAAFLAGGMDPAQALATGRGNLQRIAVSEVQDAARVATGVAIVAERRAHGYIRLLSPPSCARCVILAGKRYAYNRGFQRHPQCDCVHVPAVSVITPPDPHAIFASMSDAQLRTAGWSSADVAAIRDGADLFQVTNARRQLRSTSVAGQQLQATLVGTTRRGLAGQRLGADRGRRTVRLTPESIYAEAQRLGWSREQTLQVLHQHGYILDAGRVAPAPIIRPAKPAAPPRGPTPVPEGAKPYHRNLDGIEDLARAVENGFPPRSKVGLAGGVSAETDLITLKDGTEVVYKYGGNADAEQAASMIARAIGLRAPRVYRDHLSAVYMDYIGDAKTADQIQAHIRRSEPEAWPAWVQRRAAAVASDDGARIGLLDLMIVNGDRNAGNWMLTDAGQVVPIDHGHAFNGAAIGQPGRRIRPQRLTSTFAERYTDGATWVDNDLTPADIAELHRRLDALVPDFEHIGRTRWLEYARAVLDALAPHARGTRNLVAR